MRLVQIWHFETFRNIWHFKASCLQISSISREHSLVRCSITFLHFKICNVVRRNSVSTYFKITVRNDDNNEPQSIDKWWLCNSRWILQYSWRWPWCKKANHNEAMRESAPSVKLCVHKYQKVSVQRSITQLPLVATCSMHPTLPDMKNTVLIPETGQLLAINHQCFYRNQNSLQLSTLLPHPFRQ